MILTTLRFKRDKDSKTEYGYAIGLDLGDIAIIIDQEGKRVESIWNYDIPHYPAIFIQHEYK